MGSNFSTWAELLLLLLFCADISNGSKWSYNGQTGPANWHSLFPDSCSGKLQSPININSEETMYNKDLKEFAIWYDPPRKNAKMYVKNNGHAVQVDTIGDFFVTNGGLPHVYKTSQFHFHWGHANHHGSEHHIDGQSHPLELHIVNFNYDTFGTIAEAATQPLGLAVLGVLFEIVEEDNENLEPILKAMEQVRDPDEENAVEIKAVSLRDLLPADMTRYFRYNGSLTTPGCFESVVWTVFEQRQKISLDQLFEFRKVLKPKHPKHKKNRHHKTRHVRRSAAEKNAEDVLDELGIRGNHMALDQLKAELLEEKFVEAIETPEPTTEEPSMEAELDEDSAKRAEDNIVRHINEKKAEDAKSHEDHLKKIEDDDEMSLKEYVQETLVNNFRPVQPINGRLVQRSFKLRPSILVRTGDQQLPRYHVDGKGHAAESRWNNASSSQYSGIPFSVFIISILVQMFS